MQDAEKSVTVQDRTAALHGAEVRFPFYDVNVIRFANTIPPAYKGGNPEYQVKAVLKAAFKELLPREIAERDVSGFPSYYWTHGEAEELKRRHLSSEAIARLGLMKPEAVQPVVEAEKSAAGKSAGKRTWGLLMLHAWAECYLG
jgi:asparagine synthetase B (glutamine-hydrolysing)